VIILLSSIFTGCAYTVETTNLPSSPTISNSTMTGTPKIDPTFTKTRMPETIPAETETLLPTWTQLPTWTPLPTLLDPIADAQLLQWFEVTPECKLPCWAGITPQVTTWQEAKQILAAVVNFKAVDESGTCVGDFCNSIEWRSRGAPDLHGFVYGYPDNLISSMEVEGHLPMPLFRLDQILQQYGSPDDVFLTVIPTYGTTLDLTLAYPNHQFIIKYTWTTYISGDNINGNVVGCSQQGSIHLFIRHIDQPWTEDTIKDEAYPGSDLSKVNFRPLNDVTDIAIDDFYNQFKYLDGSECIITPVQSWQRVQAGDRCIIAADANKLYLYSKPAVDSGKLTELHPNEVVVFVGERVVDPNHIWGKYRTQDGEEGWAIENGGWFIPYPDNATPTAKP